MTDKLPPTAGLPPLPVVAYIPPEREGEYHGSDHINACRTSKAGWEPLVKLSDALAAIANLERDMDEMCQTMAAAAEEIHEHWEAHCDAEGYGPANLQRRLEGRYGVNYPGYTLGAFRQLEAERDAAIACQGDAVAAERESCAQLCDDMVLYTGFDCAAAITAKDATLDDPERHIVWGLKRSAGQALENGFRLAHDLAYQAEAVKQTFKAAQQGAET